MTFYAVLNRDMIEFIGSWSECKDYISDHAGTFQTITLKDGVWTAHDDYKLAINTLNRELDQYKMLYEAANNDSDQLIEKNSDLITLIASMSKFINTHLEGR